METILPDLILLGIILAGGAGLYLSFRDYL